MANTITVSSTVDADLFKLATKKAGDAIQAKTIRLALRHYVGRDPVVPLKKFTDMSPDEGKNTYTALNAAWNGISDAIDGLTDRASELETPPGVSPVEQSKRIKLEIADLKAKRDRIFKKIDLYKKKKLVMTPPDEATVSFISGLADSVGEEIDNATKSDQIVALGRQFASSVLA